MKRHRLTVLAWAGLTATLGLLTPNPANAQFNQWLGLSPVWEDPFNWSNGMPPQEFETALFLDLDPMNFTTIEVSLPTAVAALEFQSNTSEYTINVLAEPPGTPAFQAQQLLLQGQSFVTFENPGPGGTSITQFENILIGAGTLTTGMTGRVVVPPSGQTLIGPNGTLLVVQSQSMLESNINNQGAVRGNGMIHGSLSNSGLVAPGFSPGTLTILGDFSQTTDGVLQMEIELNDFFDVLAITGHANLAGAVDILVGMATTNSSATIITIGGDLTGEFDQVQTIGNDDVFFALSYVPTNSVDVNATGYFKGDMNLSNTGVEPNPDDIPWFAMALRNRDAYRSEQGIAGDISGDIDGVNGLTFDDIDDFLERLPQGSGAELYRLLAGIPEPASLWLVLAVTMGFVSLRHRN